MKKLTLIFLFVASSIFSQNLGLGIGWQTYLLGNDDYSFALGGPKVHFKLNFEHNISLFSNVSMVYMLHANGGGEIPRTDDFVLTQIEESVLYTFADYKSRPYFGVGFGYYRNKLGVHGMITNYNGNEEVWGVSIKNSIGVLFQLGVANLAGFFIELKYVIDKPTLELELQKYIYDNQDFRTERIHESKTVNLSSLFLSLGYEFSLF